MPTLNKYKNFKLFVDHKTRLVYPSFQESKAASETCSSKCDYETFAKHYKISSGLYHADNGAFHTETFQKDIENKKLATKLQRRKRTMAKGLFERLNGTLCAASRSMINHALSKWDKTITAALWPFAMQHADTLYNTTKRRA
jgi:hypothetical protein